VRLISAALATLALLATFAVVTPVLFANAQRPFDSDEARHAVNGLQVAADIVNGQGAALLTHLYFQRWYPPALSIYLAPFFVALGPSYWAARYPMVILLMINIALVYRVARALWHVPTLALVAVGFVATSSVVWIHSVLCMEEMLAMTSISLVVMAWARAQRTGTPEKVRRAEWILGLGLTLTVLTRTSTATFMGGAVFVTICCARASVRAKTLTTVRAIGPMALLFAVWWCPPVKAQAMLDFLRASRPEFVSVSVHELTYYWRAIATSYTVAPLVGIGIVAMLATAPFRRRDAGTRILLAMVIVVWVSLLLKRLLTLDFFFDAYPAMCLIAAKGLHDVVTAVRKRYMGLAPKRLLAILAVAVIGYVGVWAYARAATLPFLMDISFETGPGHAAAHDWITDRVGAGPTFLINGWDQLSAEAVDFHTATKLWPGWHHRTVSDVTLRDPEEKPESVERFREAVVSAPRSQLIHLENAPVASAGAWWAYRAAIASCWDGGWEETTALWVHVWDSRAESQVLSRPLKFRRASDQDELRARFRYPLLIEVSRARCLGG